MTDPKEAARVVKQTFLPLVSDIPGFVAYYWVDAGGGVMLSTTIFRDKSGADESTRRAAAVVQEKMVSLLPNPPQITQGEVVVQS